MAAKHDVVVAGGGIVGAATALALHRRGFDVALVERTAPPPAFDPAVWDPRVYAISPGSVRFLESLAVWRAVAEMRVSPYLRMEIWDRLPARALTFDAAELAVPELGFIVEDLPLRRALWDALAGVARYVPAQVTAVQCGAGGCAVMLADGRTLEAALLVAAEGADSTLRELCGIDTQGWSYGQRAIVSHVATEEAHGGVAYQHFLPDGPLAFLPLCDGRSSVVWSCGDEQAQALLALDDAAFCARLAEGLDHRLGDVVAATKRHAFPLRLLHAERYAKPGLALVGDSAHVVHPLAGQGLNLGLADAEALAAVAEQARSARKPLGHPRVLARYERRRKAENIEMLALTDALSRLFRLRLPGLEGVREFGMTLVQRSGLLKRRLAQRAMGLTS